MPKVTQELIEQYADAVRKFMTNIEMSKTLK